MFNRMRSLDWFNRIPSSYFLNTDIGTKTSSKYMPTDWYFDWYALVFDLPWYFSVWCCVWCSLHSYAVVCDNTQSDRSFFKVLPCLESVSGQFPPGQCPPDRCPPPIPSWTIPPRTIPPYVNCPLNNSPWSIPPPPPGQFPPRSIAPQDNCPLDSCPPFLFPPRAIPPPLNPSFFVQARNRNNIVCMLKIYTLTNEVSTTYHILQCKLFSTLQTCT